MADFEAIFELDDTDKIDCIFDINATVYNYEALDKLPQINGETLIGNKTSEELHLASAEDLAGLSSALDFEIQARETADTNINSAIALEIANRQNADIAITNNISELDAKVDGINANLTQQIEETQQDVNTKYNELVNDINEEIQAREQADITINQRITDVADELNQIIEENVVALQQEDTALQNQINAHSQTLTGYDTRITNNTNAITQEIADRQAGDNTLQEQVNDNKNLIDTKQDIISDLSTIRSNAQAGYNIIPQVQSNTQRIEDLTVARFPNAIIVGTPHIEGGQVSGFSDSNYLQFPFVDISRGLPFDIYFSFTTSSDVNTQQNILDAHFGIALAIQNGKGIMALSSNGTSWDIGTSTGTNTLLPNTTYFVKYSWTGTAYSAALSTNETEYISDMNLTSSLSPYKTTIFIGGSPNLFGAGSAHPFKGTINFNKSKVIVNGITVWEGMADVGLASRANVSLTNLDEVGENRFIEKQNVTDNNLATLNKTVVGAVNELDAKIKDIQLFKFPDATIIGAPTINNGQVTNFSSNNYLILPFAFDTKDRAFEINMAFTTGSNVSTTQNLLGGNYCIALLIEGGKLVFRASNNGTSWNVADITTTLTLQASTNYFVKIYFDKLSYKISYSTNGEDYTQVGYKVTTETPRHGQVFIGVGNNQHNPFLGIINLNKCNIKLNTSIIWQGMDDAGLATRADISLSNLDEIGQAKFDKKQDTISDLSTIRTQAGNSVQYGSGSQNSVTKKGLYLATHPELVTNGVIIPFINNDIAFFNKKGGKLTYKRRTENGEFEEYTQVTANNVVNGRPDYVQIDPRNHYEWEITLELDKLYIYGNVLYIDFGQSYWSAEYIKIEYKRKNEDWTVKNQIANNAEKAVYESISCSSNGLEALRVTLRPKDYSTASSFRIAQIGLINYNGKGSQSTMLGLDGGTLYGDVNFANGKLVDYVKNTDYASGATGGVIKVNRAYGTGVDNLGFLYSYTRTQNEYNNDGNGIVLSKGTLENIKENLVTGVADAKYIKKTGDETKTGQLTVTNDGWNNILNIRRSTTGGTFIHFENLSNELGALGLSWDGVPTYISQGNTSQNMLVRGGSSGNAVGSASQPVYIDSKGLATACSMPTKSQFIITEDMFDLEYDDTKGVAPYNTSYGYTNITIHDNVGVEWIEGASYNFVLDTKVATSTYRNVRVRIGTDGDYKPLMTRLGVIATGSTYFIKAMNIPFQYSTKYQTTGALNSVEYNTTYSINYSFDNGQHTGGVGAYAITRYSLCMQKPDMTWEKITATNKNYTTSANKEVNKTGFLLNHIRYYGTTTNIANGALIATNLLYTKASSVDASYSFNCSTTPNWGVGKQVYIVGTVKDDGLFYLDENQWWSVELPTSNDGKLYIRIGLTLNATNSTISFLDDRPVLYHDGTGIKEYVPTGTNINNPFSLGDSKYSPNELDNISWLASKNQWNSGDTYVDFYNTYESKIGEDFGLGKVKASTDTYTDYDLVINTTNKTFRLPLLDGSENLQGTEYISLETAIQLQANRAYAYTAPYNGFFLFNARATDVGQYLGCYSDGVYKHVECWSTRNGEMIVPPVLSIKKGYTITDIRTNFTPSDFVVRFVKAVGNGTLYYYVGETVQNANLIDAGRITEQLTNKVDVDSSWGFPSSRYVNLTIGATGTQYTAPANGWFTLSGRPTISGGYATLDNTPVTWFHSGTAGWFVRGFIPVKKGQKMVLRYENYEIEPRFFNFVYAEGAE